MNAAAPAVGQRRASVRTEAVRALVAQLRHSQDRGCLLALASPVGVLAVGKDVRCTSVGDQQDEPGIAGRPRNLHCRE